MAGRRPARRCVERERPSEPPIAGPRPGVLAGHWLADPMRRALGRELLGALEAGEDIVVVAPAADASPRSSSARRRTPASGNPRRFLPAERDVIGEGGHRDRLRWLVAARALEDARRAAEIQRRPQDGPAARAVRDQRGLDGAPPRCSGGADARHAAGLAVAAGAATRADDRRRHAGARAARPYGQSPGSRGASPVASGLSTTSTRGPALPCRAPAAARAGDRPSIVARPRLAPSPSPIANPPLDAYAAGASCAAVDGQAIKSVGLLVRPGLAHRARVRSRWIARVRRRQGARVPRGRRGVVGRWGGGSYGWPEAENRDCKRTRGRDRAARALDAGWWSRPDLSP